MISGRTILTRVVFYDLLAVPGRENFVDSSVDSHISIPLAPGSNPAWAPNGYGKTFAFKLLSKLFHPSDFSRADIGLGDFWLGNFLDECYNEVFEPTLGATIEDLRKTDPTTAAKAESWSREGSQRMVPFKQMLARFNSFDGDGNLEDVLDLWIEPDWSPGRGCRSRLCSYRKMISDNAGNIEDEMVRGMPNERMRRKEWTEIHRGRSDPGSYSPIDSDGGWSGITDFLTDDGDLEILQHLEDLAPNSIKGVLRGAVASRGMGGSEKDQCLPVIPDRSRLVDLWEEPERENMGYHPDLVLNWLECEEMLSSFSPEEDFTFTRTYEFMEILRKTQIRYVEVPKAVSDDGLEGAQRLISGMLGELGYDGAIEQITDWDWKSEMDQISSELNRKFAELGLEGEELDKLVEEWNELQSMVEDSSPTSMRNLEEREKFHEALEKNFDFDEALAKFSIDQSDFISKLLEGVEKSVMPVRTREGEDLELDITNRINQILVASDVDNPWARKMQINGGRMTFRKPWGGGTEDGGYPVREETLSFGQKSAITTECWLAWIENNDIDDIIDSGIRRCLVLDEPEAGRSEFWMRLLADRIVDADDEIAGVRDKTLVVMSHREELLRRISEGGNFHVMQPADVRPALGIGSDEELGGEADEDPWEIPLEYLANAIDVIAMGVRFPSSEELPHCGTAENRAKFLRLSLLKEYCRTIGVSDFGNKDMVIYRLINGLMRIFYDGVKELSEEEKGKLSSITGFGGKCQLPCCEGLKEGDNEEEEALARHAITLLKLGLIASEEQSTKDGNEKR